MTHLEEVKFYDPVMEATFEVKQTNLYTIISVDGREYYFNTETGKFDGTVRDCVKLETHE